MFYNWQFKDRVSGVVRSLLGFYIAIEQQKQDKWYFLRLGRSTVEYVYRQYFNTAGHILVSNRHFYMSD